MLYLVTGAAGSIGSAFVRRLVESGNDVRAFDISESGLYELSESIGSPFMRVMRTMIGDVRDRERLRRAMDGVDVVIHAAALKHVAACEYDPGEAVRTNVLGTENAILAAHDANVQRFVLVSTDKAAEPCGVMGGTKLLAEKMLVGMARWVKVSCVSVRFGNVWGSRGSVVPTVMRNPGSVFKVSDPSCTRYTMTVKQAVEFVLEVESSKIESCTVVCGMRAYRLGDLVEAFVNHLGDDWGREVVGLRPGERLHEVLIGSNELRMRPYPERDWYIVGRGDHGVAVTSLEAARIKADELTMMLR